MRRIRLQVYFPQMLFVAYTILVVLYVSADLLADAVRGTTYADLLILFAMTVCICIFNVHVREGKYVDLVRCAGGAAIVLGIGYACDGFIPLTLPATLLACAILGAVYAGTWLFFYLAAAFGAGQINRSLRRSRDGDKKLSRPPPNR